MKNISLKKTFGLVAIVAVSMLQPISAVTIGGVSMSALEGWDIYTAGTYRYGPSIIRNEDGSLDAWFAAAGSDYQSDFTNTFEHLFNDAASHTPVKIKDVGVAAQKFVSKVPFFSIDVSTPTWGTFGKDAVTITLYKWNQSYALTLKGTPVSTYRYTALRDNQWVELRCNNNDSTKAEEFFPAGTYLWTLTDGTSNSGVWLRSSASSKYTSQSYQSGSLVSGCYESALSYEAHTLRFGSYWDQVSYQHSDDEGKTWTAEKMVLKPTYGTEDQLSVCDPGVAKWGGYYYIGYTSTQDTRGTDNNAYVARSKSPTGPWEKWNGSGWGGKTVASVVNYTGNPDKFGAGEPCMIVKDSTVFFYYSWNDNGTTTRVATGNAYDENWPATLKTRGVAINKSSIDGSDHCDIKYCDTLKRFIAVHTASRMNASSKIVVWYSSNGLYFTKAGELTGALKPYLHNCGISGDAKGHIDITKPQYICYAYGSTWASWNTRLNPLSFTKNGVPVGVTAIENTERTVSSAVFSLGGTYVGSGVGNSNLQLGIYVTKGQKILVK